MDNLNKENLLFQIKNILKMFKENGKSTFLTIDIIRELKGIYITDKTSVGNSGNAKFGKYLKANSADLKIKELESRITVKDDSGRKTKSSKWLIL